MRTVVVGLDGATWDVIEPLVAAGRLPTFARLMAEGAWARLRSVIPPLSPPAWTAFMTGANPGKTRVYDFIGRDEHGRFRLVNGGWRALPSLWRLLNDAGYRTVIVNVPMTYPPEAVNGVLIAGMDAPVKDRAVGHPPDIDRRLRRAGFAYRVDVAHSGWRTRDPRAYTARYVAEVNRLAREHMAVACWLWQEERPDFLMVTLVHTDRIGHAAGRALADVQDPERAAALPDTHPIVAAYRTADAALADLLALLDDDVTLVVVSDHGFRPYTWVFNLNYWLQQHGWLALDERRLRAPRLGPFTPLWRKVQYRLWRQRDVDLMQRAAFFRAIRWDHTRAYSVGAFGSIFVNVKGRDPYGIVAAGEEYEAVCEELAAQLLALRDPHTGAAIVRHVYRGRDVFHGPYADRGPDLVLDLAPGYFIRNALDEYRPQLLYPAGRYGNRSLEHTGMHDPDGILLMWGHRVTARGPQAPAHIVDVMPTLLALYDVPIPTHVDGRPLTHWCAVRPAWAGPAAAPTPAEAPTYNAEEADLVAQRLRELGYL